MMPNPLISYFCSGPNCNQAVTYNRKFINNSSTLVGSTLNTVTYLLREMLLKRQSIKWQKHYHCVETLHLRRGFYTGLIAYEPGTFLTAFPTTSRCTNTNIDFAFPIATPFQHSLYIPTDAKLFPTFTPP
jgi:hypothetical protein